MGEFFCGVVVCALALVLLVTCAASSAHNAVKNRCAAVEKLHSGMTLAECQPLPPDTLVPVTPK